MSPVGSTAVSSPSQTRYVHALSDCIYCYYKNKYIDRCVAQGNHCCTTSHCCSRYVSWFLLAARPKIPIFFYKLQMIFYEKKNAKVLKYNPGWVYVEGKQNDWCLLTHKRSAELGFYFKSFLSASITVIDLNIWLSLVIWC